MRRVDCARTRRASPPASVSAMTCQSAPVRRWTVRVKVSIWPRGEIRIGDHCAEDTKANGRIEEKLVGSVEWLVRSRCSPPGSTNLFYSACGSANPGQEPSHPGFRGREPPPALQPGAENGSTFS